MRIGTSTIRALARVIDGDPVDERHTSLSPYRTHDQIREFFVDDLALDGEHDGNRHDRTRAWIRAANGTPALRKVLETAVEPSFFIGTEHDPGPAVEYLNRFLAHDGLVLVPSGRRYAVASSDGVQVPDPKPADILGDPYVREQLEKCDGKLASGDFDGAITNARTLLEAVLVELEVRLTGARQDHKGDLQKHYKAVSKSLRLDAERPDLDDRFKDVIRGLVTVVNGLAPLRNKMSDGHARERKPAPHHARVVVNASKTIATFLVESYVFQHANGRLDTVGVTT